MPDGSRVLLPLDELLERAASRNWTEAKARVALRKCGGCDHYHGGAIPYCEAFMLAVRVNTPAATCPQFKPALDDDGDDGDEIGEGDVGSAGMTGETE